MLRCLYHCLRSYLPPGREYKGWEEWPARARADGRIVGARYPTIDPTVYPTTNDGGRARGARSSHTARCADCAPRAACAYQNP